jgi:MoxR-like ATPase
MATDTRFLGELFRIVNGALRLDTERVRNYTAFLADRLAEAGEVASAERLRRLLAETDHTLRPAGAAPAGALPVDGESRFELLEAVPVGTSREGPLVMAESQWAVMNEFLSVAKSYGQLEAAGVASSQSLIVYGPSGCGKSRLARHVAAELGLPMYLARLDGLISSYLGSTAKNIRAIFDFASKRPCVLFLDEFDAIAKVRGDSQELGELKRVVNSFLQNLDGAALKSIIIAASNHPELLDPAVWRRFAYRLELSYPDESMRRPLWSNYLPKDVFDERDIDLLVDLSEGFTGSDIEDTCLRLKRRQVTGGSEPSLHEALLVLRNLALGEGTNRRLLSALAEQDDRALAAKLRARSPSRYSYAQLGRLLGVSKATAQRMLASEEKVTDAQ